VGFISEASVAKPKYDGVIEAIHFSPDGKVDWARTYLRRGPTFSDYILLDRQSLLEHIHAGKKFYIGKRIPQMGGVFEITDQVLVHKINGQEYLMTQVGDTERDRLENAPII